MISKLTIQGFKSIVSTEIELGRVNVFIGANGSGKSNVLEALSVLAAAAYGRVDEESLLRRGCRPGGYVRPLFKQSDKDAPTFLSAERENASYTVSLASPAVGKHSGWEYKQEIWKAGKRVLLDRARSNGGAKGDPQAGLAALRLAETKPASAQAKFLKTLAGHSIYAPDTPVLRGWTPDVQNREPVGLSGGRLAEAVSELSRKGVPSEGVPELLSSVGWFAGFGAMKLNNESLVEYGLAFIDRFFRTDGGHQFWLGASDVNEGMLYLLFVSVLCLHPAAPRLFSIDNADHSLNPLLARKLMETISRWILQGKEKRQLLLTTHNPLALDGLPLQDDGVRLFTVDRDSMGQTQVQRLRITDEHRAMAAKGWTLSRMWVNKLLGGVPDV